MSDIIKGILFIVVVVFLLIYYGNISLPDKEDYTYQLNELVIMDNDTTKYKVHDYFMIKNSEEEPLFERYELLYKSSDGELHKTWVSVDAIKKKVVYDSVYREYY